MKRAILKTLYVLYLTFKIFLIPVLFISLVSLYDARIAMVLFTILTLSINKIVYKTIIPKIEEKQDERINRQGRCP